MKATFLAAFSALILAGFCAFSPAPASAQGAGGGRAEIFTVAGVQVDETAGNGATAQQQGFASAQRIGFERLAKRLTLPADQARLQLPQPDAAALENLVRSRDIVSERRSGTRYLAVFNVQFDPDAVRTLLRTAGFTVVETRSAPVLIAAQVDGAPPPETLDAWRAAWAQGGYENELAPLALAQAGATGRDWASLYPFAQAEGATSAIVAVLAVQGNNATATLREVSATGVRDRGAVRAVIAGGDANSLRAALSSLAAQTSDLVQNDWKTRAVSATANNTTSTLQRGRISTSALYANQAEWERIKSALEGAASTVISEIRIEAVAREGALVSFSFTGDRAQLAAELGRRGVRLQDTPDGPVLRVAGRS